MQTQGRRVQLASVVPEPKEWNTVIWSLREGWAWGPKSREYNPLTDYQNQGEMHGTGFSETSPGQVEKAQHSGFKPPVCPNQLKSASRNGLFFKKKNQSGEVGNLARKLGGEGLGEGGRGLSSKRTPMRTGKVGVIRLHHFQTDLISLSSFPPS